MNAVAHKRCLFLFFCLLVSDRTTMKMLVYESQADVNLKEKVVIENTREYGGYISGLFHKFPFKYFL